MNSQLALHGNEVFKFILQLLDDDEKYTDRQSGEMAYFMEAAFFSALEKLNPTKPHEETMKTADLPRCEYCKILRLNKILGGHHQLTHASLQKIILERDRLAGVILQKVLKEHSCNSGQ